MIGIAWLIALLLCVPQTVIFGVEVGLCASSKKAVKKRCHFKLMTITAKYLKFPSDISHESNWVKQSIRPNLPKGDAQTQKSFE